MPVKVLIRERFSESAVTARKKELLWSIVLFASFLQVSSQNSSANVSTNHDTAGLTEEQRKALGKFRDQVTPHLEHEYMKTDFYLIRWLQAKDWKIADAEALLTKNLQWRKQNRMDKVNEENWTDMIRDYPYQINTFDKEGRPVGTLSAKKWDIRRAVSQGRVPRLQRYMYKMLEDLTGKLNEVRSTGQNVTQWSAIINAEGFGLFQHACPSCLPVWINFVNSASEHYPGYSESISVINVPRPLVRILRPIFASNSLKVFGNDKKTWMTYLDGKIDKRQRLPEYGGNKTN